MEQAPPDLTEQARKPCKGEGGQQEPPADAGGSGETSENGLYVPFALRSRSDRPGSRRRRLGLESSRPCDDRTRMEGSCREPPEAVPPPCRPRIVPGPDGAASPAWAWGDLGHKIICQIAFQELSDKARNKIIRLISLDETFRSFPDACTWPDHPRKRAEEHFITTTYVT